MSLTEILIAFVIAFGFVGLAVVCAVLISSKRIRWWYCDRCSYFYNNYGDRLEYYPPDTILEVERETCPVCRQTTGEQIGTLTRSDGTKKILCEPWKSPKRNGDCFGSPDYEP